ncbi:MAG TPA: nucleotidyl transferase AbiEii/AbiGii toxin family protein [Gemmatimonadaceae bacterium]|nr:nucleotidyl transferase AbiEii/AbiGii toxin family protein [Gemmatimonadaceae bacterium]
MRVREPTGLERLLAALTAQLGRAGLPFMLIGGQAVLLHGAPRLTEDVDATLGADPSRLAALLEVCAALGLVPLPQDVESFVAETFVLPARHTLTGIRVDFIFSSTEYERQAIQRALPFMLAGEPVPFATAEDLIIHKLFAARPRDLEDVRGVVLRKGDELDWSYLEKWAREFANVPGREGMPAALAELRQIKS